MKVIQYYEKKQKELQKDLIRLSSVDVFGTANVSTRVFVGNLTFTATVDEVREYFEPCGAIKDISFPQGYARHQVSRDVRASRGIAFITFENLSGSRAALQYDQRPFAGRRLRVGYASTKENNRDLIIEEDNTTQYQVNTDVVVASPRSDDEEDDDHHRERRDRERRDRERRDRERRDFKYSHRNKRASKREKDNHESRTKRERRIN